MSETFEQAIERCLMDGTTAQALRLIAADFDDASDDCIDAIAIRQGADGLDTLVARVANLTASRDRASDACASVQKERDELREMLGEAVEMLRQSSHALSASYQEAQCEWTNSDKAAARHNETVRNFRNAVSALLARYEAGK